MQIEILIGPEKAMTIWETIPMQLIFTFIASLPFLIYLAISQKDSGARMGFIGLWFVDMGKTIRDVVTEKRLAKFK